MGWEAEEEKGAQSEQFQLPLELDRDKIRCEPPYLQRLQSRPEPPPPVQVVPLTQVPGFICTTTWISCPRTPEASTPIPSNSDWLLEPLPTQHGAPAKLQNLGGTCITRPAPQEVQTLTGILPWGQQMLPAICGTLWLLSSFLASAPYRGPKMGEGKQSFLLELGEGAVPPLHDSLQAVWVITLCLKLPWQPAGNQG